jgi:hypothetical protein
MDLYRLDPFLWLAHSGTEYVKNNLSRPNEMQHCVKFQGFSVEFGRANFEGANYYRQQFAFSCYVVAPAKDKVMYKFKLASLLCFDIGLVKSGIK